MPRKAHGMSKRYATPLKSRRGRRRNTQARVGEAVEALAPERGERGARPAQVAVAGVALPADAASPTLLAEYRVVMADVRRIGMVAGPLILLLVVLALFLR